MTLYTGLLSSPNQTRFGFGLTLAHTRSTPIGHTDIAPTHIRTHVLVGCKHTSIGHINVALTHVRTGMSKSAARNRKVFVPLEVKPFSIYSSWQLCLTIDGLFRVRALPCSLRRARIVSQGGMLLSFLYIKNSSEEKFELL